MISIKAEAKRLVAAVVSKRLVIETSLGNFLRRLTRTDTVSLSDSGDLIKTDYCDMSYFDADYVGSIDTF